MQKTELSIQAPERDVVTVCASFTAEPIKPLVEEALASGSAPAAVQFSPYSQVLQELHSPASMLVGSDSGLNVLLLRASDYVSGQRDEVHDIRAAAEDLATAFESYRQRCDTPTLVIVTRDGRDDLASVLEEQLASKLDPAFSVDLLPRSVVESRYPVPDPFDEDALLVGHIPYNDEYFASLSLVIGRYWARLGQKPVKVIAVDCDNTLWSGVCGESAPEDLKVTAQHLVLHQSLRKAAAEGVVLCLCSKNAELDVKRVFETRKDLGVSWNDFVVRKVNWQAKSENLREIAEELNLGLDSIALLDDNPVEIAEVRSSAPEALALRLPLDSDDFGSYLEHCWPLDRTSVTDADRERVEGYKNEVRRSELRSTVASFRDFLTSLNLKVDVVPAVADDVPRISQMTMRTNQFNATTRRLDEAATVRIMNDSSTDVFIVRASDRFGDYGTVGLIVLSRAQGFFRLSDFLLSCRVLGRGVEHKVLEFVGSLMGAGETLEIDFEPTPKNEPIRGFLQHVCAVSKAPESTVFRISADDLAGLWPPDNPAKSDRARSATAGSTAARADDRAFTSEFGWRLRTPARLLAVLKGRQRSRSDFESPIVDPKGSSELRLAEIWMDVLNISAIGRTDRFVDLGGTSLDVVRVHGHIAREFGRNVPITTLLDCPTIADIADFLDQETVGEERAGNARAIAMRQRAALKRARPVRSRSGVADV